jgi:hypothetical protein
MFTIETIRQAGMNIGYDACRAAAFIPNPYPRDHQAHDHWADGYDLGVLQARDEMEIEESQNNG